jgi:hypothetical protein
MGDLKRFATNKRTFKTSSKTLRHKERRDISRLYNIKTNEKKLVVDDSKQPPTTNQQLN